MSYQKSPRFITTKFQDAFRGIFIFIKNTKHSWVQVVCALVAIFLGFYLYISTTEWIFIIFSIGMVLSAEAFNTALEIDIDLTSPDFHPYARDTKDVAAGAVLITSMMALIVGLMIFVPKIF